MAHGPGGNRLGRCLVPWPASDGRGQCLEMEGADGLEHGMESCLASWPPDVHWRVIFRGTPVLPWAILLRRDAVMPPPAYDMVQADASWGASWNSRTPGRN